MRIRLIIIAIPVLLCCITVWAAEPLADHPLPPEYTYVDHEGYRYSYQTLPSMDGVMGIVETRAPKTNEIVYKEENFPASGCPLTGFTKPRRLKASPDHREMVALCGSYDGHQQILMLFEEGELLARLNYAGTDPDLVWNREFQTYLTIVGKRVPVPEGGGLFNMQVVYEFNLNSLMHKGFYPIYNSRSFKLYLQSYHQSKPLYQEEPHNDTVLNGQFYPMMSSLVSTADTSTICSELKKLPLNVLSQSVLNKIIVFNEQYGFPSFDLSICQGNNKKHTTVAARGNAYSETGGR